MRPKANGWLLRTMRLRSGMKQYHLAELMGVSQTTVSRWECGLSPFSDAQIDTAQRLMANILGPAQDLALRRLIESSAFRLHLVCDRTHRLFAASPPRAAEWKADLSQLMGRPMLRFASPEILKAESSLPGRGWFEHKLAALTVDTGPNGDSLVPIPKGRFVWERLLLADGTAARLVTTLK